MKALPKYRRIERSQLLVPSIQKLIDDRTIIKRKEFEEDYLLSVREENDEFKVSIGLKTESQRYDIKILGYSVQVRTVEKHSRWFTTFERDKDFVTPLIRKIRSVFREGKYNILGMKPPNTYITDLMPRVSSIRDSGVHNGEEWTSLISDNYHVDGRAGPKQKYILEGWLLSVWANNNSTHQSIDTWQEIPNRVIELVEALSQECSHSRTRELSQAECRKRGLLHFGMCWHVYECLDCGDTRSYDSSG